MSRKRAKEKAREKQHRAMSRKRAKEKAREKLSRALKLAD
jgi:hypothetical protein